MSSRSTPAPPSPARTASRTTSARTTARSPTAHTQVSSRTTPPKTTRTSSRSMPAPTSPARTASRTAPTRTTARSPAAHAQVSSRTTPLATTRMSSRATPAPPASSRTSSRTTRSRTPARATMRAPGTTACTTTSRSATTGTTRHHQQRHHDRQHRGQRSPSRGKTEDELIQDWGDTTEDDVGKAPPPPSSSIRAQDLHNKGKPTPQPTGRMTTPGITGCSSLRAPLPAARSTERYDARRTVGDPTDNQEGLHGNDTTTPGDVAEAAKLHLGARRRRTRPHPAGGLLLAMLLAAATWGLAWDSLPAPQPASNASLAPGSTADTGSRVRQKRQQRYRYDDNYDDHDGDDGNRSLLLMYHTRPRVRIRAALCVRESANPQIHASASTSGASRSHGTKHSDNTDLHFIRSVQLRPSLPTNCASPLPAGSTWPTSPLPTTSSPPPGSSTAATPTGPAAPLAAPLTA